MNKRYLFFCCLFLLALGFSRSGIPARGQEESPQIPATVQSRREALAELIAERERLLDAGDAVALVRIRNQITELHLKFYDLDSAVTESQASLDVARQFAGTSNATLLADTLTLCARVHIQRDENKRALDLLNKALKLSRDLGYRPGEAEAQTQLGVVYFALNDLPAAEEKNNQALKIWRDLQDDRGEAQTLGFQGEVYIVRDRAMDADRTMQDAETIWRALHDRVELSHILLNRNLLAIRQGQWQTALALLDEAESILPEKNAEPFLAGKIAMSFGEVYEAYAQLEPALNYFREALRLYRDGAHDKRATIDAGNKVGRVQARLKDYAGAREQIQEGLELALETENNLTIGLCHEDLGRVWLEAGSYESARLEFLSAINYFSKGNAERPLARSQSYLGQTEHLLGHFTAAAAAYEKALGFFQKTPDYTNEAALSFGLGKLALQQGQLAQAEQNLRRSISLTERLRENAWSNDLRSSFLASVHDRYQSYAELLMTRATKERDHKLEIRAFEVNESGRARALIDSLHDVRELRQAREPALLHEEAQLQKDEQRLIDDRAKLISQGGSEAEKAEIDKKLTEVRSNYETLQARISNNSRFNHLLRAEPLSYEQIRKQITDAETSLLSYSLGDKKSFAWLVTKDGLHSYELPDQHTIDRAANELIGRLQKPPLDATEETQLQNAIDEVSRLVLQPLAEKLQTGRLIVVGDGVLQYVPFQILKTSPGTSELLISKLDIVEAPSASALALLRQQRVNSQPAKLLVGFGDAVFSPQYSPATSNAAASAESTKARAEEVSSLNKLPRLFNARRELSAISELAGNDAAFYVEYNATRENLLSVDLSQYRILHVVTHGVLDAKRPELSGLVFSLVDANKQPITGFVSLADVYKLHSPDLVVLSACYTALGQEQNGEGLIGLTRGFMYAGASGVVASLWQVDDRATAELMKYFYANMLQGGMKPAAALRDAQNRIRSQPRWSSPYYWAGFTFQGDYDLRITAPRPGVIRTYQRLIAGGPLLILLLGVAYWYMRRRQSRT